MVYFIMVKIACGIHIDIYFSCNVLYQFLLIVAEGEISRGDGSDKDRKLSLEKTCPDCLEMDGVKRKMGVKFNFDHIQSNNGDAWVEFTCNFCKR